MRKHAFIGFLFIVLYWWVLFSGQGFLYFADTLVEHFALQSFLKSSVLSGQDVSWNPYIGLGAPSLAEGHMGAYSPGHWLHFLADSLPHSLSFLFLLHLWVGWMGMASVGRLLRLDFPAQVMACLIFILGGYVTAFSTNHVYILAVSQFPWMIWAALRFQFQPGWKRSVVLAAFMALHFFSGAFPIFFITSVCVTFISLWGAAFSQKAGWYLFTAGLSMLLASAQLLPTFELIFHSQFLAGKSVEYLTGNSLNPPLLLSLLFPHIWGFLNSQQELIHLPFFESTQDYFDYDELHNYIGILPLVFLFIGLLFFRKKIWQSELKSFVCLFMAALILSLGAEVPGLYWVLQFIPGFNYFKDPAKWSLVLNFAAAFFVGFTWVQLRLSPLKKSQILGALLLCCSPVLFFYLRKNSFPQIFEGFQYPQCEMDSAIWGCGVVQSVSPFLYAVLALLLSGLFLIFSRQEKIKWALLLFVFLDIWVIERSVFPVAGSQFYQQKPEHIETLKNHPQFRVSNGVVNETQAMNLQFLNGDLAAHWQVFGTSVTTPLVIRGFDELMREAEKNGFFEFNNRIEETIVSENLLDAVGVGYLYEFKEGTELSQLLTRTTARPRFFLTQFVQTVESQHDPRRHFFQSCHTEKFCGPALVREQIPFSPHENFSGELSMQSQKTTELVLRAQAAGPSLLVWTDMNYPGWNVQVDGKRESLVEVNGLFKGVFLTEGIHSVRFWFDSDTVRWGRYISLVAWLGLLVFWLVSRRFDKGQ